jgi:hypothetical protein
MMSSLQQLALSSRKWENKATAYADFLREIILMHDSAMVS